MTRKLITTCFLFVLSPLNAAWQQPGAGDGASWAVGESIVQPTAQVEQTAW